MLLFLKILKQTTFFLLYAQIAFSGEILAAPDNFHPSNTSRPTWGIILENGTFKVDIVIPKHASATEIFAAQELSLYFQKISGSIAQVSHEDSRLAPNLSHIFIGKTKNSNRYDLRKKLFSRKHGAFIIQSTANDLFIRGVNDNGTLYGTYRFLESLGVRWVMPTELGEIVPHKTDIKLKPYNILSEPAFSLRRFGTHMTHSGSLLKENIQWQIRMGYNSFAYLPKPYSAIITNYGKGTLSHNFKHLIGPSAFQKHPEFFALVNGKRVNPQLQDNWKFCLSNPDLPGAVTKYVSKYLDNHPEIQLFSLTPSDGNGWCECSRCQHLCNITGDQSAAVFSFARKVANNLHSRHPNVLFPVLAYSSYRNPPPNFRPANNLRIVITEKFDYSKSLQFSSADSFYNNLTSWVETGAKVWIYIYSWKMSFLQLPLPVFRDTMKRIKAYHDLGIDGVYIQGSGANWGAEGLDYYTTSKAIWNPELDPELLFDDYCSHAYGQAAGHIKDFFSVYQKAFQDRAKKILPDRQLGEWSLFESLLGVYTEKDIQSATQLLEQAITMPGISTQTIKRIELLQVYQGYVQKFIPFARANKLWRQQRSDVTLKNTVRSKAVEVLDYLENKDNTSSLSLVIDGGTYSARHFPQMILKREFPDTSRKKKNNASIFPLLLK